MIILGIIINIIVHELAHLYFCLKYKCKIDLVSIGFGKPIFKFRYKRILFHITPILLGGYVSVRGEENYSSSPYAICNLKVRHKIIIGVTGCIANIIVGIIFYILNIIYKQMDFYIIGYVSILLGVTNLLPIPCLDGGVITWYLLFLKKFGKKKGIKIYRIISKICFTALILISMAMLILYSLFNLIIYCGFQRVIK